MSFCLTRTTPLHSPTPASLPTPSVGAGALCDGRWRSYEQLDALADGLPANGAGLERRAAVDAGGVSALEDELDVVVDADGAGDPLLHLPVARLQLLQQVVLLRVLGAGAAVHLCLVWAEEGQWGVEVARKGGSDSDGL